VTAANPIRVLVVDDHAVVRRGVVAYLEALEDVTVAGEAGTGTEALDALARAAAYGELPDVVLMDLQMPEMDGFEATACIRKRERDSGVPRVPIIALTAHAMQGDRQRCLDADMDGYVAKPIKPVELFEVIDRVMAATEVAGGRRQVVGSS
jgi:CheY-like chemotaxis protein